MASKPPSIGDIVSQFAVPPGPPSSPAQEWLDDLSHWLETGYEKLIHAERSPGLHASGLGSVCARREMIEETFGKPAKKARAGNMLTYDFGHAMHFWWQNRYLGPKQELWGDWKCSACPCAACGERPGDACPDCKGTGRKTTRGLMPLNCECGTSWQDSIRYMEFMVENKALNYVGHTDGILLRKGKKSIFEFKTDGPSTYEDRKAPNPEHIIQAHAYMQPLGLTDALIVYQAKGGQCKWTKEGGNWVAGQVHIKPFVVNFDPVVWGPIEQRIRDHHEARALIQTILDEKRRPTRDDIAKFKRVCDSPKCDLARNCPVSRECFNLL